MSPTAILPLSPVQQSHRTMRQPLITDHLKVLKKRPESQRIKKKQQLCDLQTKNDKLKKDCISKKYDPQDRFEIKKFKGKGRGVVTLEDIPKGFFVCEYAGELIDEDERDRRETQYLKENKGCYMYYFTRRNGWKWCCVDATAEPRKGCLQKHGRLINHSIKNANCKMVVEEYNHTPHLILVAKEDIKAGTELLYDYGERNKEVIKNFPWLME